MSAVDRVMRAYASKHVLDSNQAAFVRAELSKFIDELMQGSRRTPTMLVDAKLSGRIEDCPVLAGAPERDVFDTSDVRVGRYLSSFKR